MLFASYLMMMLAAATSTFNNIIPLNMLLNILLDFKTFHFTSHSVELFGGGC